MMTENKIQNQIDLSRSEVSIAQMEASDELISNFKSLYYVLNASPDTQVQVFNDEKKVTLDDIYELNEKINGKLNTHSIITNKVSIYISFNDGKSKNYENWHEFQRTNWNIGSTTKSVNIIWDFYIKLPNYQAPQRHSLKVRMGSELRPDEYFRIMLENDNDSKLDSLIANVVCRVDFVNSVICDELINLVKDWYDTLKKEYNNQKMMEFYTKYPNRISKFIDMLFPVLSILIIYFWSNKYLIENTDFSLGTTKGIQQLLLWVSCSSIFVFISKYIGFLIAAITFKKARSFQEYSYLFITKGDDNKRQETMKRNKNMVRDISINLLASTIFAVIVFIWGIWF